MSILNLDNAKWLIGTLAIPAALAIIAQQYQHAQADRQINDARLRLYTELLSKREEADSALRQGIFDKVLATYLTPSGQELQPKLAALDLLASNFHDSLDLSPLFWQLDRQIGRAPAKDRPELSDQLIHIADMIKDRQISALELGSGRKGEGPKEEKSSRDKASAEKSVPLDTLAKEGSRALIDDEFSFPDPDPFAPRWQTMTRQLRLWVVHHDAPGRRLYVTVQTPARDGEPEQHWEFWLDLFDFPMVTFSRLSRSERFAVVLTNYEPARMTASVKLLYFPSTRVGAKDRPFIDDVISDLVRSGK
jgi:hypothetical protein